MKKIKNSLLVLFAFDLLIKRILYWFFPEKIETNTGVSFGVPAPTRFIPIFLLTLLLLFVSQRRNKAVNLGLLAVFLGGCSNYIDRLLTGGVIDYLRPLPDSLIFNFSDIMIAGGLIYLFSLCLRPKPSKAE